MQGEPSTYSEENSYECLPCAEGCDSCEDASPCIAELNWPMRTTILILACAIIGFLPPAALFTFRYQQVKVSSAAACWSRLDCSPFSFSRLLAARCSAAMNNFPTTKFPWLKHTLKLKCSSQIDCEELCVVGQFSMNSILEFLCDEQHLPITWGRVLFDKLAKAPHQSFD